ncbi:large ribosomal subunit protein bL34 [Candidatus Minimicrobia naudis]
MSSSKNIWRDYQRLLCRRLSSSFVFLNHAVNDDDDTKLLQSHLTHPARLHDYPRKLLPQILLTVFTIANMGSFPQVCMESSRVIFSSPKQGWSFPQLKFSSVKIVEKYIVGIGKVFCRLAKSTERIYTICWYAKANISTTHPTPCKDAWFLGHEFLAYAGRLVLKRRRLKGRAKIAI